MPSVLLMAKWEGYGTGARRDRDDRQELLTAHEKEEWRANRFLNGIGFFMPGGRKYVCALDGRTVNGLASWGV